MKYDVIVVGMGPSSVFLAYELIKLKKAKNVLLIEEGHRVEKRICPITECGRCMHCKPVCNITSGFSGAGAFSDGKLSLYNKEDEDLYVGGELHKYIGLEKAKELIDYCDKIYLEFGAEKKLQGIEYKKEIQEYIEKSKKNDLSLISIPIRHLGTEKSHELYGKFEKYLEDNAINMMFDTVVSDLIINEGIVKGVEVKTSIGKNSQVDKIYGDNVVVAVGRKGAKWLTNICNKHNIKTEAGVVDIGVRFELQDEVMKNINKYMYEGKFIGKPGPFKDKVRTFCQNPSGFVSAEEYDNNLTLVNGHSYKEKKSNNTNLAILVSHKFNYPFDKPIEYGINVAKNLNELGAGNVLVQRLGDIYRGKRTWEKELKNNKVVPTLEAAVAGDITFALGYRTMTDILEFIKSVDKVVEGFADPHNLLYAPEIKFYSNKVKIDNNFETSIKGLYSIGDGGGLTRGLMMASASGISLARVLANKI